MPFKVNKHVLYTLISALVVILGTVIAIQFAKGRYRLTNQGFIAGTGLLSANSFPTGAQVLIDGKLVTATDDTLYLEPGEYQIEIQKEGYSHWKKTLRIDQELVTQTNAQLYPQTPSLTPLTFAGAENISPSPDGQKLIYYTASASAQNKNGLYLLEMGNSFLSLQKGPKQISDDDSDIDLATAQFIWSPDSTEIMLVSPNSQVMLDLNKVNNLGALPDVSVKAKQILSSWEEEMYLRERQFLSDFPAEIITVATSAAKNVYISPDKKRLFYTATTNVSLPDQLMPTIPAASTQAQTRSLVAGNVYIYDQEEDRNFLVGPDIESSTSKQMLVTDLWNKNVLSLESSPSAFTQLQNNDSVIFTAANFNAYHSPLHLNSYQWAPDSTHLIYTTDSQVRIVEIDGSNDVIIYSGPFVSEFVYPWPDGSKLLILTSFGSDTPNNLYAIELK